MASKKGELQWLKSASVCRPQGSADANMLLEADEEGGLFSSDDSSDESSVGVDGGSHPA